MSAKNGSKNSDENTDIKLVVPAHGRGALRTGGNPGNKGGTGRPPSKIRTKCRDAFEDRLPFLQGIVDDEDERTSDRIKAHDLLGKYGGVDKLTLTVDEQPEQEITPERIAGLWEQIQRIRTVEEFEKLLTGMAAKQLAANGR